MQPGPPPEDFQAILSRFHTWAEKHPANGNGNGHANPAPAEEIREIPYEEAMRQHRNRQVARTPRRTAPTKTRTAAAAQPKPAAPSDPGLPEEDLPLWAANLPVVPDTEPVIELRTATSADLPPHHPTNVEALLAAITEAVPAPPRPAKPSPPKNPVARTPKSEPPVLTAAAPAVPPMPARAFVDAPPAPLASRHQPQRKSAPPTRQPAIAAAVVTPPVRKSMRAAAVAGPPQRLAPSAAKPAPSVAVAKPAAQPVPCGVKTSARQAPPVSAARTPAKATRIVARPGIIVPPIAASAKRATPRPVMHRALSSPPTKAKPRALKHPQFQQILANTVQQPKAALAPNNRREPDRTRRITTRFSRAEERRVEKCAAALGITVSAYLRRCALSALAQNPIQDSSPADLPVKIMPAKARKASRQSTAAPLTGYTPPPSLFGGWLSLLRNRFLGPPIRFSEDA
jgi:hypothetical protein